MLVDGGAMTDFKTYAAKDAVNFSTLKHMAKSPKHYRHARDNPGPDTAGRLKGRGAHTAVLEPDRLLIDYALFKPADGKTKAVRKGERWEKFKAVHAEDSILKLDEYEHCLRVAKAVHEDEVAGPIIAACKHEQTIEWVDEETLLPCKARLDMVGENMIGDLKGVTSTDPRKLAFEVARMAYHCQLAFYREGMRVLTGRNPNAQLICVEHNAPHDVAVVDIDDDGLYAGWELVRKMLHRVAECRATNRWPGRSTEVYTLDLPAWIYPGEEDLSEVGFEMKEAGGDT